jgi:small-conductance mechanosensitive channel/CRP-like cAMP-binding protein
MIFGEDGKYLLFLAFVALIFALVRVFDAVVFDFLLTRRQKMIAPLLLRQIVSFTLYVFLFAIAITRIFDSDITGVLISGTVVAAVLGLALQDTLGNLFSGISLHIEETFSVGDVVRSGDLIGVVEGTNWRATRLRTFNNNIVVIPNSMISRERIEVFPRNNLNARLVTLSVAFHVPPAEVIRVLDKAVANVNGVAREIPSFSRMGAFGESGITYEIKYWTRRYQDRDSIDAEIRRAVWYALRRNGIPFAFPVRAMQQYTEGAADTGLSVETVGERLRDVEILAPLNDAERRSLAAAARVQRYSRGETLLGFGQSGDSMYVIHEGSVSVRIPADGTFAEVAQLGAGSIVGEMALLTGESRTADVIALTDVVAIRIEKNDLRPVLEENPDLASSFTQKIMERRIETSPRAAGESEEHLSVLGRIRSWFALGR